MKYLYAVGTGKINPLMKRSRKAVKLMRDCDGFVGLHMMDRGCLWFYDTEGNAKRARNIGRDAGIEFGYNIARFIVGEDNVPEFDESYME